MADYNISYLELMKKLKTLKLILNADKTISVNEKVLKLKKLDELMKMLDERYSENMVLSPVIDALNEI